MAGSLVYKTYVSDSGTSYSIKTDESNAESVVDGNELSNARTDNFAAIPTGLKVRYCLAYNEGNQVQKKKFIIGNPDAIKSVYAIGATITTNPSNSDGDGIEGTKTFIVTAYRGEKANFVPAVGGNVFDTGLTDGDIN